MPPAILQASRSACTLPGFMLAARTLVAAAAVLGLMAGAAHSDPEDPAAAPVSAEELLHAHQTRAELSYFMGVQPFDCAQTSDSHRICTWSASRRQKSWALLAPTLPTRDRVNLVCELPSVEGPRSPDSCSLHPRRSNRTLWRGVTDPGEEAEGKMSGQELTAAARGLVDRARTALELSRLVGQGPESCVLDQLVRRCLWRTTHRTEGHGTLAMAIGASVHKKVRMECWLPAEGGPRRLETCKIEVGS